MVDDVFVKAESVPPFTARESAVKSADASETVMVIVSVWPALSVPEFALVNAQVGSVRSMVTTSAVVDALVLVAESMLRDEDDLNLYKPSPVYESPNEHVHAPVVVCAGQVFAVNQFPVETLVSVLELALA